jgi:transcriptional regulator
MKLAANTVGFKSNIADQTPMYLPKHFEEKRIEVLHQLIDAHPLGALVTLTTHGLEANHIPFAFARDPEPFGTLRGHIARANPLWRECATGAPALVIFQGPEGYISPSWYITKHESGEVVPTWNYAVVHAHGALRFIDDRNWLRRLVENLTNRHEKNRSDPWKVTDAPPAFIDQQLGAIVGVEIIIERLVGKWKVSQNRPDRDRDSVVEGLRRDGRDSALEMARLVRRSKHDT